MIQATQRVYGSLDCIVVDGGDAPDIGVVICHGYGAPGDNMVDLAGAWIPLLGNDASRFRFVFPAAPLSLAEYGIPDGLAWWPLNTALLMQAVQANTFEELHTEEPPGIVQVRETLCESINAAKEDLNGESTPLILGGFSQGAMLTMEASLRGLITPPKLLLQFSGTVVCEKQWEAAMGRLSQTKVYQSHGQVDPILPFSSAERLHNLLVQGEVDATFTRFMGPHTIDGVAIRESAQVIQGVAASLSSGAS